MKLSVIIINIQMIIANTINVLTMCECLLHINISINFIWLMQWYFGWEMNRNEIIWLFYFATTNGNLKL